MDKNHIVDSTNLSLRPLVKMPLFDAHFILSDKTNLSGKFN